LGNIGNTFKKRGTNININEFLLKKIEGSQTY
jgi:hypothetical protein